MGSHPVKPVKEYTALRQATQRARDSLYFPEGDHEQRRPLTIADLQRAVDLFKQVDPAPVLTVNCLAEAHRLAALLGCDNPAGPIDARFVFVGIVLKISEAVPRGQAIVLQEHRDGRDPDLYVVQLN